MKRVIIVRLFLFLLIPALTGVAAAQSIVQVVPLPNTAYWNQAWGLTSDGTFLYVASTTSDATLGRRIYRLSLDGTILDSTVAPAGVNSNQGLAVDSAGNFYFLRRYTASGTILKLSPAGAVLDSFRIWSGKFPGGLAWDGTHLWFSLYYPNTECGLYKLDFATKTVIDTILVPTLQPYGMTWDGSDLLYVENGFDGGARGILRVDPVSGDTTGFIPEPVDGTANGTNPLDAAWDGASLWLLAEPVGASSGRALYRYEPGGAGTPQIGLASPSLDFGNVRIGTPLTLTTSILNTGTAPLHVDSVRMLLSADFSTTLVAPLTVAPGGSQELPVTFIPAAFGPDTASLRIMSDDPVAGTIHLALRGAGVFAGGVLSVPASHAFGPRRTGSSTLWRLTLQNQGGGGVQVTGLALGDPAFEVDSVALPIVLDSLERATLRVWFHPGSGGNVSDTLRITSTASNGPVTAVALQGSGDATPLTLAQPLWQYTVPLHPISNTFKLVKGIRAMNDITGDGKPEVILCTENYWTMAVNGNASGSTDSLWAFNTYISNSSAGSIGSAGDYSHQKALQIASDLNGDGYNDVVIGTGGGNEHVYALNGRTGQMLWTFGTDAPDSFSLGDITAVDVARDFNGDGVPDVAAAAAATESGGIAGRRSAYLFNGANGALLWQAPLPGFTHGIISLGDISGDGVPDVAGAVGEPSYRLTAFNGTTGATLWNRPVPSSTGGAKEVLEWPVAGETPDIILGAFWGPVYRIDGGTGTQVWSTSTGGSGVMQFGRLRDVTGDSVDELVVALLLGGAKCLNGATGAVLWSLPLGNVMGLVPVPDLDQDGYDEVALAVQDQGAVIVRGQNGQQLGVFPTGTNQAREVALVQDMDQNSSMEILVGGKQGNVAMLSGGLLAGPNDVRPPAEMPSDWVLYQNYPNPFNPSTTIRFTMPVRSDITLAIFDIVGRSVAEFSIPAVPPGMHEVVWDGTTRAGGRAASGVYLYRLRSATTTLTRSMLLLK